MTDNPFVSTGWCMPSNDLLALFRYPADRVIYPDDCGKPHNWERHSMRGGCQCSMCDEEVERWLECSECIVQMQESAPDFEQLWETAPWA